MTQSLSHSENGLQQSMNDFLLCFLGNLSGNWLKPSINEVLATFRDINKVKHFVLHAENESQ